jgi:altronate dehydratase small subunit
VACLALRYFGNTGSYSAVKAAFLSHASDNVATMLDDVSTEPVRVVGAPEGLSVTALDRIERAHKIALQPIRVGSPVVKYGVRIGIATRDIEPGQWVHLHNCRSLLDERSANFESGREAASESKYA